MLLPALFHWSPADRRDSILSGGLQLYSESAAHSGDLRWPYLCLSPTPSSAWGLSGDMEWVDEVEAWDLWQVRLTEGDDVSVRGDFGPTIREVRVRNAIPADRIWWVACREPMVARCEHGGRSADDCAGCFPS